MLFSITKIQKNEAVLIPWAGRRRQENPWGLPARQLACLMNSSPVRDLGFKKKRKNKEKKPGRSNTQTHTDIQM